MELNYRIIEIIGLEGKIALLLPGKTVKLELLKAELNENYERTISSLIPGLDSTKKWTTLAREVPLTAFWCPAKN